VPKKTTGRFDTRQMLVERICSCVDRNDMSMEAAGKSCGVSAATASKIYNGEEGQAYREIAAAQVVDGGMKVVSELVDNPPTIIEEAIGRVDPAFAKYELAKKVAHTLACSTLVPDAYLGKPNDCFVAINMGAELGMDPFTAIQSIAVIEGKPCLYGDGLIGVVRASPKCMWIKETLSDDGKTATCETQRKDDPQSISATYAWDDAVQAGINTKFNWKKHPKRMLQMRARAYCLRDAYPDLLKGLGVVEERQDHEDTPPPVTDYELPKPETAVIGATVVTTVTLSEVEHAMKQSDSMEDLLKAGAMAKMLTEQEQNTARITYKQMRTALQETANG
jgi:hypothetical protein